MSDSVPELDEEKLKRDLHGEQVGQIGSFHCDFCGMEIPIDEPVMYDITKVHDMPNLESVVNLPDGWALDAARCQQCEVEGVIPETDGWEEAVVMLSINESNGVLSADASNLTVIDYSPGNDGHYPPPIQPAFLNQQGASISRWAFIKSFVENTEEKTKPIQLYREMLEEMDEEAN